MKQHTEFHLISEIHISFVPDSTRWEVAVVEAEGHLSPVALYNDINTAFERVQIIHSLCDQPVTIKIIWENGDTVAVESAKISKLDFLLFVDTIYIYFNKKTSHWEMCLSSVHSSFISPDIATEDEAIRMAEFVKTISPDCQVIHEKDIESSKIADNTCRARDCKWNVNDSCLQLPRSSSLPLPAMDPSFETWTKHNHPTPRSCLKYSPKEISVEGVDGE